MGSVLLCLYFLDYSTKWQRNLIEDMEKKRRKKGSIKKIHDAKY